MVLGFCIFEFFPGQVLGLFSASQAMLTIGIPAMRIICLHFLLAGTSIVLSSVLQALGNGMFSLIVSVPAAAVMGAGLTSGRDRKVTSSVIPRVKRSFG